MTHSSAALKNSPSHRPGCRTCHHLSAKPWRGMKTSRCKWNLFLAWIANSVASCERNDLAISQTFFQNVLSNVPKQIQKGGKRYVFCSHNYSELQTKTNNKNIYLVCNFANPWVWFPASGLSIRISVCSQPPDCYETGQASPTLLQHVFPLLRYTAARSSDCLPANDFYGKLWLRNVWEQL